MTVLVVPDSIGTQAPIGIGAPAPRFDALLGVDGRTYGLTQFAERAMLVLIFSSNRCPTAKAYGPRMNALQADYESRGVQLIALNSNDPHLHPEESYPRMISRAAEDSYRFPYVVDADQRVARDYGANCTFHAFVLDRARRIRYHGRFDDSRIPERVTTDDLRNALDDLLSEREVQVPITRPFGCSLDFV